MGLKFCSFASGSSGNCYLVKSDETAILIDAGISGKRILEGLEQTETPRDMVRAILVTHEHIDHVKSLPVMTKRIPDLQIYANEATWDQIDRPVQQEKNSRSAISSSDRFRDPMTRRNRSGFPSSEKAGRSACVRIQVISAKIFTKKSVLQTCCFWKRTMRRRCCCSADTHIL